MKPTLRVLEAFESEDSEVLLGKRRKSNGCPNSRQRIQTQKPAFQYNLYQGSEWGVNNVRAEQGGTARRRPRRSAC
eukprot:1595737-Rhodomonas_salina.2